MAAPTVGIVGLNALRRDLVKLTADAGPLNKAFAQAGMSAAEPVASATRSALPQVSGELATTVRVSRARSGAGVRMGNASHPYAGWVEFGGIRKAPHETSRPYLAQGRYLFPAARRLASTALEIYDRALLSALQSFDWTNETTNEGSVHD